VISSETIQETYDRCSSFYDLFFKPWLESGRARALEHLELFDGARILEVGVGTGLGFDSYPANVSVLGFDFSHGMLRQSLKAREEASCPIDLLQMDAQNMAFPDNTFDRILAAYVLTVVPDPKKALMEILRVAKPGARIAFINHLRSDSPFLAWIEDTFHPVFSQVGLFNLDKNLLKVLDSCAIKDYQIEPTTRLGLHHIISFNAPE